MWTKRRPPKTEFLVSVVIRYLPERMIDGQRRAGHDVLIVHIGRHANDAARTGADIYELHHRDRSTSDVPIDGS